MPRLAVLSNAASGGNAHGRWALWSAAGPHLDHALTHHVDALPAALERLLEAAPDVLAIDGGDGTLQSLLTHCLRHDLLQQLPPLAVLPGGTTNACALDLSATGRFGRARRAFLALQTLPLEAWPLHERPTLLIDARDARYCGLFFGAGDVVRGVELWRATLRETAWAGTIGVANAVARTAIGIARRQPPFDAPTSVSLSLDGAAPSTLQLSALMVTSLERLMLRMRPMWGDGSGPLACTWLDARPPRLLRTLPLALWGAGARLGPDDGYGSTRGARVDVVLDEPWLLDGEVVQESGALAITASAPLRFVRLGEVPLPLLGRDGVPR